MSKVYRVHVHDHADQGRWLASADFPNVIPSPDAIAAQIPVLNTPGRYEVRVCLVSRGEELHRSGWLQDGPPPADVNPYEAWSETPGGWDGYTDEMQD